VGEDRNIELFKYGQNPDVPLARIVESDISFNEKNSIIIGRIHQALESAFGIHEDEIKDHVTKTDTLKLDADIEIEPKNGNAQ
jgi:hypothetical protein